MVTLALAIGANTAMFSVLNGTLFQPLPYRSPDRLAMLWTERPNQNVREGRSAYWNIEQLRSFAMRIDGDCDCGHASKPRSKNSHPTPARPK
jgi:putative ABC transport system permease protein